MVEARTFTHRIAVVLCLFVLIAYLTVVGYARYRVWGQLEEQAASYLDFVASARAWTALHGGVYVLKAPGVESNPFLRDLGVEPDIVTADGRVLTMRNPSMMTREVADITRGDNGVTFFLTSDRYVNRSNAPDDWEASALAAFARGESSVSGVETIDGRPAFRYMEPLYVEESCLECHAAQGYEAGDLRGGISVVIPYAGIRSVMVRDAWILGVLGVLLSGLVLGSTRGLIRSYQSRLNGMNAHVERMAATDALTGLDNRWMAMARLSEEIARARRSGEPLSIALLDLDRFKTINDTHGHAVGDDVLQHVAKTMAEVVREYDTVARVGGEEFLIIAPGVCSNDAVALAERVRLAVGGSPVDTCDEPIEVTVSGGVTELGHEEDRADMLLKRADEALYRAKRLGRDRVELAPRGLTTQSTR